MVICGKTFVIACLYTYMPIDTAIDLWKNIHGKVNNHKICNFLYLESFALYGSYLHNYI